jgi:glycosyltransferase involved in cell wall biosynthesis
VEEVKEEERKEGRVRCTSPDKKQIKFVFNGRGEGGAERSVTWMLNTLHEMGHDVSYLTPNDQPCGTFRRDGNKEIHVGAVEELNESCDIVVLYANDWVWELDKTKWHNIFNGVDACRKVFCVNYKLGRVGLIPWTRGWDLYMFLNHELEAELLKNHPGANTVAMAPPTILSSEIGLRRDIFSDLRLVRHSSQGDSKYPKDFNEIVHRILNVRKDCSLRLMPAPSFLQDFGERVISHKRNVPPVPEFLGYGNCFWYLTPHGYTEGGPKVVMEAQASGIPVIANNSSGMKDRIVPGTGWLCDTVEDHIEVIKSIEVSKLRKMGDNAREYARTKYDPMLWIRHILGEL